MKKIFHIFKKESLELRRDKRTFYSAIVGPVFLIYLMMMSFSFIEKSFSEKASQKLHVVKTAGSNILLDKLRKVEEIQIIEVPSLEVGRKMVEEGKAKVVLDFKEPIAGMPVEADAIYDPDEIKAKVLVGMIEGNAGELAAHKINSLLDNAGVSKTERIPVLLKKDPISKKDNQGAMTLAGVLPYLIVIWSFYGAFGIAS